MIATSTTLPNYWKYLSTSYSNINEGLILTLSRIQNTANEELAIEPRPTIYWARLFMLWSLLGWLHSACKLIQGVEALDLLESTYDRLQLVKLLLLKLSLLNGLGSLLRLAEMMTELV